MDHRLARTIWHHLEMVNAVAYFAPECREGAARLGLKGFWMGYFACRAAPMGAVGAAVVEATFFNFHPARVRRSIPDAWSLAHPADVLDTRASSAAAALRRLLTDSGAEEVAQHALPILDVAIASGVTAGRPLFAANRDVGRPDDPVAAFWQASTTLREHRGDGHVALLTGAGLDGCEVHVLFSAFEDVVPSLFEESRGWSSDDWRAAVERLRARDLLEDDGLPTALGRELHESIERRTDELAISPYEGVGDHLLAELVQVLAPAARRIAALGEIAFPNPMGLPPPLRT
ncbi:MAG: SCO6745 family protein [Acidimicrobiales bacterium]